MASSAGCLHQWLLSEPVGEDRDGSYWQITRGRCEKCGAERLFETEMRRLESMAADTWHFTNRRSDRPKLNEVHIYWDED